MNPTVIEAIFAPAFLVMGLSHLLQPQLWVRFFATVRQTGVAAVSIPMYTLLVVCHNVWVWDWPLFLTIAGGGTTIKSVLYRLAQGLADRALATQMATTTLGYRIVGAVAAFFGGVLNCQVRTHILSVTQ